MGFYCLMEHTQGVHFLKGVKTAFNVESKRKFSGLTVQTHLRTDHREKTSILYFISSSCSQVHAYSQSQKAAWLLAELLVSKTLLKWSGGSIVMELSSLVLSPGRCLHGQRPWINVWGHYFGNVSHCGSH